MGLLTGPHQMLSCDEGSSTILLSSGERPVLAPEYAVKAPLDVMAEPVSYTCDGLHVSGGSINARTRDRLVLPIRRRDGATYQRIFVQRSNRGVGNLHFV